MKSNICIDVEFLAGTDIKDAAEEAKRKALEWDVAYVCFKVNGVLLSVGRTTDIDFIVDLYRDEVRRRLK